MSRFSVRGAGWTLSAEVDYIDVTSSYPSWRESWRMTDSNGHEHRYAPGFPTLYEVVDASHWCDGTEGFALHDPHEHEDESHYECAQCGEVIEPDTESPIFAKSIPGAVSHTLEGFRSDGWRVTMRLDPDEAERIRATPDDATALAILDAAPVERIVQREYR